VLLVSEDLDELLELSDRIAIIFDGRIVHETATASADIAMNRPAAWPVTTRRPRRAPMPEIRARPYAYAFGARHDRARGDRHAARTHRARRLRRSPRQRGGPAGRHRPDRAGAPRMGRARARSASSTPARAPQDLADCPPASGGGASRGSGSATRGRWAGSWSTASRVTRSCRSLDHGPARPSSSSRARARSTRPPWTTS